MQKRLNQIYAANQFFYFSLYGAMFAFVSVFLLGKGFENSTIGLVLSLMGVASLFIQTFVSSYLDKDKNNGLQNVIAIISFIILVASVTLYFSFSPLLILFLVILTLALAQSSMGLVNSLAFIFEPVGVQINYGLGRGMGSLAYAIMTLLIGFVVEKTTPNVIPLFYALFSFALLVSARLYFLPKKTENIATAAEPLEEQLDAGKSIFEFVQKYKRLMLLMLGVVLLYFGHVLINNFFIQVITPIGGTHKLLGIATFIAAIAELPAMMKFNFFARHVPLKQLIKLSTAFFVVKHALTFLATNMAMIYLAQFLQIGAFALSFPSLVEYVNSIVSIQDLVKGQSLLTGAITLSSVLASFFGGILLDEIGVSLTLFISLVTTVIGLFIIFLTVEDTKNPLEPLKDTSGASQNTQRE